MDRRSWCLALGSLGFVGLSGYLDNIGGHVRPDEEPDTVPATYVCEENRFQPHYAGYDADHLHWGDVEDYSMRVNALEFEYGDTAEIELSADDRGSDHKWNLEIFTENGWRDVRGIPNADDRRAITYDDVGKLQDAKWRIELTEDGIIEAGSNQDILEVCPDLVSARYRFVYWGITNDTDDPSEFVDLGIAVAFDIVV